MSECPKCNSEDLSVEVTAFAVVPVAGVTKGTPELADSIGPYIEDVQYENYICDECGASLTPAELL